MRFGIVSVASAVTINNEIVDHGENAFLANSVEEWKEILVTILENKVDFITIGNNAREKIIRNYTFDANSRRYREFINRNCIVSK